MPLYVVETTYPDLGAVRRLVVLVHPVGARLHTDGVGVVSSTNPFDPSGDPFP